MRKSADALHTFLFTDIEGSTRLWTEYGAAMRVALERHDQLVRAAIIDSRGTVFKTVGDAFFAVFDSASDAVRAAIGIQHALLAEDWQPLRPLGVRVALHSGEAQERSGDYFGTTLNVVARLLNVGHAGQILATGALEQLIADHPPAGVRLKELGDHWLRDLGHPTRILQIVAPGLPETFQPIRTHDEPSGNLPVQLTSFVGRERERTELAQLLDGARLVTLVGVGGSGKTRLALQAAAEVRYELPDGVWLVELAALDDPEQVPGTVAGVLGLREEPDRSMVATLCDHLRGKRLLLVLDSCEHLIDACATLSEQLLQAAPGVRMLATSREALRVRGEQVWTVAPLRLPDPDRPESTDSLLSNEAVRLFCERATSQRPAFRLTDHNAAAVVGICRRLDGLPLAIELAAARVRTLAPEQIFDRLDQRFWLLSGQERRAGQAHHQTLQAAIDWSHALLTAPEQRLFRRLAVFHGGWTLDAAEEVSAHDAAARRRVLEELDSLVEKSLVAAVDDGATMRYHMLETIAAYARERLEESGDLPMLSARLAAWVLDLAESAAPELRGAEEASWLRRLSLDEPNIRAALVYWRSDPGDSDRLLRLANALAEWWLMVGRLSEGRDWLEVALRAGGEAADPSLRAAALQSLGDIAFRQADFRTAQARHEEGLALHERLGNRAEAARSLRTLGSIADEQARFDEAERFYSDALQTYRALGDAWGEAASLNNLGLLARKRGDYDTAARYLRDSLLGFEVLGVRWAVGLTQANLGDVAVDLGDVVAARNHYGQSLAVAEELEDREGRVYALTGLADVARLQADYPAASQALADALPLLRELGAQLAIAEWCECGAALLTEVGAATEAARLFGAAAALREAIAAPLPETRRPQQDACRLQLEALLGSARFDEALAAGARLPWEALADQALTAAAMARGAAHPPPR
jgi:predicted ATPase/class 3 adenylate cyclase